MNWTIQPEVGLLWHNGETYGFNSIVAISRKEAASGCCDDRHDETGKVREWNVSFDNTLQDVTFSCLK